MESTDLDKLRSFYVDATNDAVSADVTTVLEDVPREASGSHLNAALTSRVEPVELQIALDHL